jgi:bifunctional non-homologous end joining protein LigD
VDYQRKRDFQRTPEPKPRAKASRTGRLFVVQKHRAQRLHYDFRLELDGVLLSWAVPKGPSLDPSEKRLAVQVEDHPIEYGSFEGIIPEDEYGGGTVMLWDRGEWSALGDAKDELRKGTLKFKLEGSKLRGAWTLVQMKEQGKPTRNWLLIKERDDEVRREDSFSIMDEEPFSAVSGRTIGEIAAAKDCTWSAGGAHGDVYEKTVGWRRGLHSRIEVGANELAGAKKAGAPREMIPLQAKVTDSVPGGDGWIHEILQEGDRILCRLDDDDVLAVDARGRDWTGKLPAIVRAAARLPISNALLDGVVSHASSESYNTFDIVFCDGHDLRATPLLQRKQLLRKLLENADPPLVYCDHVEGQGALVFAEAKRLGAAGVVSKPAASKYAAHGAGWTVVRLAPSQERLDGELSAQPRKARAPATEPDVAVAGIKLTHPNRVLYPEERVTKRMVAGYYEAVAPMMLPHIVDRPLSLYRCPGGIEKECFFQKQLGEMSSQHLHGSRGEDDPYVVLDDARGLVTLAQWNVLEIHGWGCREDDLDHPDMMVFDLDPGPNVPWEQIVEGAKGLRLLLEELGLKSFVKTSGGKGLHVVVPLTRPRRSPPSSKRHTRGSSPATSTGRNGSPPPLTRGDTGGSSQDWDDVKDFAARAARKIVELAPKHFTVFMSKPERRGKVFIDYFRNHRGSTCVAPYSTRARPGAFVSMPVAWDDLDGPQPRFHVFQALDRLKKSMDPWQDFYAVKQCISADAIAWLRT